MGVKRSGAACGELAPSHNLPLLLAGHGRIPLRPPIAGRTGKPDTRRPNPPNTLLLLEHPHVYTRGRLSRDDHLLTPNDQLAALGVPVYETDRGGQVTYHGPGQLVGYPIINLRRLGIGPLQYVRRPGAGHHRHPGPLQHTPPHTEPGLTGVWTAGGKIAAIGVKISRGIAFHGFALNVNTDLSYYRHIVPCGITDRPVTSMAAELGAAAELEATRDGVVRGIWGCDRVGDDRKIPSPSGGGLGWG